MDRHLNPYTPGAGAPPPALLGRQSIIEEAEIALHRILNGRHAKSFFLVGLRGVGKTVLLNTLQTMAELYGYKQSILKFLKINHWPVF
jgi:Cdc6-like AAA superfamily ATPase